MAIVVALVAAGCYLRAIPNDYAYDSTLIVRDSPIVNESGRWSDVWALDHWHGVSGEVANRDLLYRPVALATYKLVRAIAGPSAWPQHLLNVLLHAVISGLVVVFVRRVGASRHAAIIAGLAFAVLPIHTEVICDVVGRTDLIATLGIIAALLIHRHLLDAKATCGGTALPSPPVKGGSMDADRDSVAPGHAGMACEDNATAPERDGAAPERGAAADKGVARGAGASAASPLAKGGKRGVAHGDKSAIFWSIAGMVACFCALGAKESGIAVLPLLVIFDWYWTRERAASGSADPAGDSGSWKLQPAIKRLSYVAVPAFAYFALRFNALGGTLHQAPAVSKTINVLVDAPAWQHALGVIQAWGMYWAKTFVPLTLCPDYSINAVHLATTVLDPYVLLGLAVAAVMLVGSMAAWRAGNRLVAILCVALMTCYLPTSNTIVLIQVFFAERLWYLPSLFVCVLIGVALAPLFRREIVIALFALAVGAMALRCWVRCPEWKDTSTVAAAAYRDHPDAVATLVVYGTSLAHQGRYDEAIRLLNRAVQIDLGFTVAHRALGEVYAAVGDTKRALHQLRIAEMQFPGHPETQAELTALNAKLATQARDELEALRTAADADPDNLGTELSYIRRLVELGSYRVALDRMKARDARFSGEAAWQKQYAVTLLYAGRRDEAIERYRAAAALASRDTAAQVELAALLMERRGEGDLDEADRLLTAAQATSTDEPAVLVLRAELLAIRGDVASAVALYRQVLDSIPPDDPRRAAWQARARVLGAGP